MISQPNNTPTTQSAWDGECKKYQKLFIQNSFKDITEEEKNLYSYAMWYCQEQRAKYR